MNLDHFGLDSQALAGSLEARLRAVREAGLGQIMLSARDIVDHPGGEDAAISAVRASGLRVTGFQALRNFEGLSGDLHAYKVDVAKAMLEMCRALGSKMLVVWSSTSTHASGERDLLVSDLRKLAMLAVPLGLRIGYEALSWGRHVNEYPQAAAIVEDAGRANLGVVLDSFHILAAGTSLDELDFMDCDRIFLVQLSDFLWQDVRTPEERSDTASHYRVFPGEGVHSGALADLARKLDQMGYRGDYLFEVFNEDYLQLAPPVVARRAYASAKWVVDHVSRRSLPVRRPAAAPR